MREKWNWFSSTDTNRIVNFNGYDITFADWDKRTPGKFKPEFTGDGMICLNSKLYHIWDETHSKSSCKGTQKKRNTLSVDCFKYVLNTVILK